MPLILYLLFSGKLVKVNYAIIITKNSNSPLFLTARAKLYQYHKTRCSLLLPSLSRSWMTVNTRRCVHLIDDVTGERWSHTWKKIISDVDT